MLIVLGLLAFLIEFAFMVGVFMLASGLVGGGAGGTVVGVLAVVLVAGVWGMFIAPKARRRIPKVPRALAAGGAVLFVGAGLLGLGHQRFGLVLMGAGLVLVAAQLALDEVVPGAPRPEGRSHGQPDVRPDGERRSGSGRSGSGRGGGSRGGGHRGGKARGNQRGSHRR